MRGSVYEGVIIVPTALCRAEAWSMRSTERKKLNVFEMMCLSSLEGTLRIYIYIVINEEVRTKAGMERKLASMVDQCVTLFGHTVQTPPKRC